MRIKYIVDRPFRIISAFIVISLVSAVLFSCGENSEGTFNNEALHKNTVTAYFEKTIPAQSSLQLELKCDNGNMEIHSWNKKEVRLEATERLTGKDASEKLKKLLERFSVSLEESKDAKGVVMADAHYGGGGDVLENIGLKIYIPHKVKNINANLGTGRITFIDDLSCLLDIACRSAEIEVNNFEGRIKAQLKEGGFRINQGKLYTGSGIATGRGNIRLKADFQEGGVYIFKSGEGIIEAVIPKSLKAAFDTADTIEAVEADEGENPAILKFECPRGKIIVSRY